MTPEQETDFVTAWAFIRSSLSDDIAQQAVLQALDRVKPGANPVAYLWTRAKYLKREGYNDGADFNRIGGSRQTSSQLMDSERQIVTSTTRTPEDDILLREEAARLVKMRSRVSQDNYTPRSDMDVCSKGHFGRTFFVKKKAGNISKECRVCQNMATKAYKLRKKAGAS